MAIKVLSTKLTNNFGYAKSHEARIDIRAADGGEVTPDNQICN